MQPGGAITEFAVVEDIPYVTFAMVEAAHGAPARRRLEQWMRGQTMLLLPSGEAGIYAWDYKGWLEGAPITD